MSSVGRSLNCNNLYGVVPAIGKAVSLGKRAVSNSCSFLMDCGLGKGFLGLGRLPVVGGAAVIGLGASWEFSKLTLRSLLEHGVAGVHNKPYLVAALVTAGILYGSYQGISFAKSYRADSEQGAELKRLKADLAKEKRAKAAVDKTLETSVSNEAHEALKRKFEAAQANVKRLETALDTKERESSGHAIDLDGARSELRIQKREVETLRRQLASIGSAMSRTSYHSSSWFGDDSY